MMILKRVKDVLWLDLRVGWLQIFSSDAKGLQHHVYLSLVLYCSVLIQIMIEAFNHFLVLASFLASWHFDHFGIFGIVDILAL